MKDVNDRELLLLWLMMLEAEVESGKEMDDDVNFKEGMFSFQYLCWMT